MRFLTVFLLFGLVPALCAADYAIKAIYSDAQCSQLVSLTADRNGFCQTGDPPFDVFTCNSTDWVRKECDFGCLTNCVVLEATASPSPCTASVDTVGRWWRNYCGYPPEGYLGSLYAQFETGTNCAGSPTHIDFNSNNVCSNANGNSTMDQCIQSNNTVSSYTFLGSDCAGAVTDYANHPGAIPGCQNDGLSGCVSSGNYTPIAVPAAAPTNDANGGAPMSPGSAPVGAASSMMASAASLSLVALALGAYLLA